jgi:formamidopyrimidine-DNA glycosylase
VPPAYSKPLSDCRNAALQSGVLSAGDARDDMPELPDIVVYLEALEARTHDRRLERVRIASPFLLRTVSPPISTAEGRTVRSLRRLGKRIAIGLDNDCWLVLHLMIAGRLHWHGTEAKLAPRRTLAAFDFESGSLTLTEAGSKKRASLYFVEGESGLDALDPGGLEPLDASLDEFAARLTVENHTLKRSLTDPHLFSGIGNAYSDEILHAAQISPAAMTMKLTGDQIRRLHESTQQTLQNWTARIRAEARGRFPEKVTAFREGMAVHGRFGKSCPRCGAKVQRIRYADNETNYCARCQTGGRLLADRSLSRLLKRDWPRTLEELEALTRR